MNRYYRRRYAFLLLMWLTFMVSITVSDAQERDRAYKVSGIHDARLAPVHAESTETAHDEGQPENNNPSSEEPTTDNEFIEMPTPDGSSSDWGTGSDSSMPEPTDEAPEGSNGPFYETPTQNPGQGGGAGGEATEPATQPTAQETGPSDGDTADDDEHTPPSHHDNADNQGDTATDPTASPTDEDGDATQTTTEATGHQPPDNAGQPTAESTNEETKEGEEYVTVLEGSAPDDLGILMSMSMQIEETEEPDARKVYICHAAGREGTTHYTLLHLSVNALDGHFDNPGTPAAGHEDDIYLGASAGGGCPGDATPEPTEQVTPEPTEEVTLEATEAVTVEPTDEATAEAEATDDLSKLYICHAAGQDGTRHYNLLHISVNAVYGPGGHFNENGTPQAGHEDDILLGATSAGGCPNAGTPEPTEEVTVEPTNEATPEMTVEPTDEATPEVTPEPTEETTPEFTPEPTDEPTPEVTEEPTLLYVCHGDSELGVVKYKLLHLPEAAVYGPDGHFNQNNTPQTGHANDVLLGTSTGEGCPDLTLEVTPEPTQDVTAESTDEPTQEPTDEPTDQPTDEPTDQPTDEPTQVVTQEPTETATPGPTEEPTAEPTAEATLEVTVEATVEPTEESLFVLALSTECVPVSAGVNGFPVLDLGQPCPVDNDFIFRPPWEPIEIEAPVCPDWGVYHSDQPGSWDILRLGDLSDNATGPENLTRNPSPRDFSIGPSISSDARWVAFTSTRDGNWEIFVTNVYTEDIRRVTYNRSAVDLDAVWSPTGEDIVFESNRNGNWDLYRFNVLTGVEEQLTDSPDNDVNASWSPDGGRILYQSDRDGFWQIYELNLGSGEERLVSDGVGDDHAPSYSPDGTMIAFRSYRDGANSVIYVVNADGTELRRVSDPAGDANNAVWSPLNNLLGYDSTLDGDTEIYAYDVESGQTRKVTDNDIPDYAPSWYCASDTLLFTSEITSDANVFSASGLPIDGPPVDVLTEATQLTSDPASDQYPEQTPNEENASRSGEFPSSVKNK